MADVTLFEVDLSESTFVAPLGRHVVADRVETEEEDEESSGGRGKLLVVAAVGVSVVVGGLAFAVARRFGGDDEDAPEETEWGEEGWDGGARSDRSGDDEYAFDEDRDGADGASAVDDEGTGRSGAVAAVVGLLFLLLVTALARRRLGGTDGPDETGEERADADGREPVAATE